MTTVQDIYAYFDTLAPFCDAEEWDNSGLLLGSRSKPVRRVLICLDLTRALAEYAVEGRFDLVLTHHPIIFHPLRAVTDELAWYPLLASETAVISMHTNLDAAAFGSSAMLGEVLELRPVARADGVSRFVAPFACEPVDALTFARRARGLLADAGQDCVPELLDAGGVFDRVAVCGGAGGDFIPDALRMGAGLLVTGEAKHNQQLDALNAGVSMLLLGHHVSEAFALEKLREKLVALDPTIEAVVRCGCPSQPVL